MSPPTYPARPVNGGPLPQAVRRPGRWYHEPKLNGWRALVHVPTGAMFNRRNERLTIEAEFAPALAMLQQNEAARKAGVEWLDCEALERRHGIGRGTLFVLDLVLPAAPALTYEARRDLLVTCFGGPLCEDLPPCADYVHVLSLSIACDADRLWERLKAANASSRFNCEFYEGVVAKRADSPYPLQLRSPDQTCPAWVKHRWAW